MLFRYLVNRDGELVELFLRGHSVEHTGREVVDPFNAGKGIASPSRAFPLVLEDDTVPRKQIQRSVRRSQERGQCRSVRTSWWRGWSGSGWTRCSACRDRT